MSVIYISEIFEFSEKIYMVTAQPMQTVSLCSLVITVEYIVKYLVYK